MTDHLDSKNLIPFKKRRNVYRLPNLGRAEEEQITDAVDPELRAEEQSFVRHYLGFADILLRNADKEAFFEERSQGTADITEMPQKDDESGKNAA